MSKCDLIAIVGSGGKSSIMHDLAESLYIRDKKNIWITTTTKVSFEYENKNSVLYQCSGYENIPDPLPYPITFLYSKKYNNEKKLSGPCPILITNKLWINGKNTVIFEADGGKGLPLKYYETKDRQLTGQETKIIICISVKFSKMKIGVESIHRFSKYGDKNLEGKEFTYDFLEKLIYSENGYMKNIDENKSYIIYNGIESKEELEIAENLKNIHLKKFPKSKCFARGRYFGTHTGMTGQIWWNMKQI